MKKGEVLMFKSVLILIISIISSVFLANIAYAGWECTPFGEVIPHGVSAGDVCYSGCCIKCIGSYITECRPEPLCMCGHSTITDTVPPNITIIAPQEGQVFTDDDITISFELDEESEFVWRGLDDDRSPSIFCRDCKQGTFTYRRQKDGPHTLTISAEDHFGNYAEKTIDFFIDATPPVIKYTKPENGSYESGTVFEIEYDEETTPIITIFYGTDPDNPNDHSAPLVGCPIGRRQTCSIDLDLASYDGQTIYYYFTISDGFNSVTSEIKAVIIDTTPPLIQLNSPLGGIVYPDSRMLLDISITNTPELTDFIEIIDKYDDKKTPKASKICSKNCDDFSKTYSFRDGFHEFLVRATDIAGNVGQFSTTFTVDTKEPRLKASEPKNRKYTNGTFTIQYQEDNTRQVILYWRPYDPDTPDAPYNPVIRTNQCPSGNNVKCSLYADISSQHDKEIEYYFEIKDDVWNSSQRKPTLVGVDTVLPVITHASVNVTRNKATFNITISEEVEDLSYIDLNDPKARPKRLCRNCDVYDRYRSYRNGYNYTLKVTATDKGGNQDTTIIPIEINY